MKRYSIPLALTLLLAAAAAMADDHGGKRGSATTVAPTSTTEGHLDRGDKDYFRIDLPAAGALALESASGLDTVGRLEDSGGVRITTDNNSGAERNFRIARDLDAGVYYLMVRGRKGATGAYVLTAEFTPDDDHGDSRGEATAVSTASSTAGELERRGDLDYFRIAVAEAGLLEVASLGDTDTSGRLEEGDGTELAADEDGGAGGNFRIAHDVEAGNYYVAVRGFNDARTGEYILEVGFTPVPTPEEGSLRLSGGSETRGRLEIFHQGEWGTVCDDHFDKLDATAACRQLGYNTGRAGRSQTPGTGQIWLDDLACTGDETRLDQCPHAGFGVHNCSHVEDAAVSCSNEVIISISTGAAEVTEGQTVYFTLTRRGPDSLLAVQLTVPVDVSEDGDTLSARPKPDTVTFAPGSVSARLQLNTVNDQRYETDSTITATVVDGESYEVGNPSAASVLVTDNDHPAPERMEVYINAAYSTHVSEGQPARFAVSRRGPANSFSAPLTIRVRISESGDMLKGSLPDSVRFGAGGHTVWPSLPTQDDAVNEANSTVAFTILPGDGYELGDPSVARVVVTDNDDPPPVVTGFTLVNVSTGADAGALADGAVVDLLRSTDLFGIRAEVAGGPPGSMGLALTGPMAHSRIVDAAPYSLFGVQNGQIVGRQLPSGDYQITATPTGGAPLALAFTVANGVGVTTPLQGDLRLRSGSATSGRLEIFYDGEWGTVCDDYFGLADAQVACRQLGHVSVIGWGRARASGNWQQPIWLDDLACTGDEARLDQCPHAGFGNHNCIHFEDAAVTCVAAPAPPPEPVTVEISAAAAQVSEGQAAGFTLTRRGAATLLSATTTVSVLVSEDGDMLSPQLAAGATFAAYATTASLSLPTQDDASAEVDSTVTVTIVGGDDYVVGSSSAASVLVTDNDPETVEISAAAERVFEGEAAVFTLTRLGPAALHSDPLTVAVQISEDGDMLSLPLPDSVAFGAGSTTAPALWLETADDESGEVDSTVTVTIVDGEGYQAGNSSAASIVVADNDTLVVAGFTLVNAPTAADVGALEDGAVVDLSGISANPFGIRADMLSNDASRVRLTLVSHWWTHAQTLEAAPYSLFGTQDGQIVGRPLPSGDYRITATPESGAPLSVAFTVENGAAPPYQEGDLRLAGGTELSGRLEILHEGEWGTVCDDYFGREDAEVACRQMGHASVRAWGRSRGSANWQQPIWLDDLACIGDEARLDQCPHAGFGNHNCIHFEDAAVTCVAADPEPAPAPTPTLNPPTNALVDVISGSHLRFNWDPPAGASSGTLIYDVCIAGGTADCAPGARRYARPFNQQGSERWTFHLFGNPSGGADGLAPGTTYRMCVLARSGHEFSPTVCATGATSGG